MRAYSMPGTTLKSMDRAVKEPNKVPVFMELILAWEGGHIEQLISERAKVLRKPRVGEIEGNWVSYPRWTGQLM